MSDLDLALFDEPERVVPPPEPELTAGERMRRRQAARIAAGYHPLSLQGMPRLRLHDDAPRDPEDRTGPGPRCGGCVFRRMSTGHSRAYPKCAAGARETERGTYYPHASMSEATDVRAWWPACAHYQAAP